MDCLRIWQNLIIRKKKAAKKLARQAARDKKKAEKLAAKAKSKEEQTVAKLEKRLESQVRLLETIQNANQKSQKAKNWGKGALISSLVAVVFDVTCWWCLRFLA